MGNATTVHMGNLIRERVNELRMKHIVLAEKISLAPQTLNHVYKRKYVDSELLIRLCVALEKNFFKEYARSIDVMFGVDPKVADKISEKVYLIEKREKVIIELVNGAVTKMEKITDGDNTDAKVIRLEERLDSLSRLMRDGDS